MKKISTFAAAAALAIASAAPVMAQDAKTTADPFVSTQGALGMSTAAMVGAGLAVGIILIAAIDSSDDT